MDIQPNLEPATERAENACVNCGNPQIEDGYPHKLCAACREAFIKYPIPIGIKLFGLALLVIILSSLVIFPKQLAAGIHLERAKAAEASQHYLKEQEELKIVLEYEPNFTEGLAHQMVAAFYNSDLLLFSETAERIQHKKMDNEALLDQVNALMTKVENDYIPSDSLSSLLDKYHRMDSIPDKELYQYVYTRPNDVYAATNYAGRLREQEQHAASDSIIYRVADNHPHYIPALQLAAVTKRELHQWDESIGYCDQLLNINRDLPEISAIKARNLLQQGHHDQGLQLSEQLHHEYPQNGYCSATLALAYHLIHKTEKRDALVAAAKDSSSQYYMTYVKDVISGKEKF